MGDRYISTQVIALVIFLSATSSADAYIGPGLGIGILGAVAGLLAAVLLAFIGIFWYPIKVLVNKKRSKKQPEQKKQNKKSE